MKTEWLADARKIPDEVMNYVRRIAVCAIEESSIVHSVFENYPYMNKQ